MVIQTYIITNINIYQFNSLSDIETILINKVIL